MRIMILLGMAMMFFSCNKEGDQAGTKLDLVFELRYDGALLSGPEELYELNDSVKMRFSKISFYLSDFKLNGETQSLPLLDILHISFLQNINGDAIQEMKQKLSFDVPAGNYRSLSFGLGLTPAQNSTVPADYEPGSALSLSGEYWPAWKSYIFEKLEGSYQLNGGESQSVALHVGSDDTYHILEWTNGFSLSGDRAKVITIPIDLKFILNDYPITEAPVLHKLEQLPHMKMIASGFSDSMNN